MSVDLEALLRAVRARLTERTWDAGVRLARAGRVQVRRRAPDELEVAVSTTLDPVARTVWFWPQAGDWECECGNEACLHAAAGVIALRQEDTAPSGPEAAPRPGVARLRYALRRRDKSLTVRREVLHPDGSVALVQGSLREVRGLHAHRADLQVDDLFLGGTGADMQLPSVGWARLLRAWAEAGAVVTLDGDRVEASAEVLTPVVAVRDDGEGFRLSLHRAAGVDETFSGGVARVGTALHPATGGGLTDAERRALVAGARYAPGEVAILVGEVLPRFRRTLTVKVHTKRLPERIEATPPRLVVELVEREGALEVSPRIVYGEPPVARVEGDRLVPIGRGLGVPERDRVAEDRIRDQVERELQLPLGRTWRLDRDQALDFVRNRLPRAPGHVQGRLRAFAVREEEATLRLEAAPGGLGVRVTGDADPRKVVQAWRSGEALVPLLEGGFAPLPRDWLDRWGHLLADVVEASGDGSVPRHAAAEVAALAQALDSPPPPGLEGLAPLVRGFDGLPEFDPPPGLEAELRPYQLTGHRWLRFLTEAGLGGVLADDMGLGKTLQALSLLAALPGRHLVVAPTSVLRNWEAEARRFVPGLRVHVFHGATRHLSREADLVITSYALLRLDESLRAERWQTVTLDEAQNIKNPESQTAQAAFSLAAHTRFCLTGTPVENRLEELWSQLHFCMPGFLGGRERFRELYALPVRNGDLGAARALQRRIRPFVLRRRKHEVARELPPRTDMTVICPLPPAHKEAYDAVVASRRDEVLRALRGSGKTLEVLEYLLRLRQAACHPALLPGGPACTSGKVEVLLERLREVVDEGHKALVFSQWTSFLDLIEAALDAEGLGHVRLDGTTRDRAAVVAQFQAADGPPVFLLSLKAGGTGLNLTAADYVFHTDPWWNPAVEDQATDRAHRIGQDRPVFAMKLLAEGTVEERIAELQHRKRAIARAVLEGSDGETALSGSLTREDLAFILDG